MPRGGTPRAEGPGACIKKAYICSHLSLCARWSIHLLSIKLLCLKLVNSGVHHCFLIYQAQTASWIQLAGVNR